MDFPDLVTNVITSIKTSLNKKYTPSEIGNVHYFCAVKNLGYQLTKKTSEETFSQRNFYRQNFQSRHILRSQYRCESNVLHVDVQSEKPTFSGSFIAELLKIEKVVERGSEKDKRKAYKNFVSKFPHV